jgi:hypothetical protein
MCRSGALGGARAVTFCARVRCAEVERRIGLRACVLVGASLVCMIDGCDKPRYARGWCSRHWQRWKRNRDPLVVRQVQDPTRLCAIAGCDRSHSARGWCVKHYWRWKQYGHPLTVRKPRSATGVCSIEGCDGPHEARGWCAVHYTRFKRYGDPQKRGVPSIYVG